MVRILHIIPRFSLSLGIDGKCSYFVISVGKQRVQSFRRLGKLLPPFSLFLPVPVMPRTHPSALLGSPIVVTLPALKPLALRHPTRLPSVFFEIPVRFLLPPSLLFRPVVNLLTLSTPRVDGVLFPGGLCRRNAGYCCDMSGPNVLKDLRLATLSGWVVCLFVVASADVGGDNGVSRTAASRGTGLGPPQAGNFLRVAGLITRTVSILAVCTILAVGDGVLPLTTGEGRRYLVLVIFIVAGDEG